VAGLESGCRSAEGTELDHRGMTINGEVTVICIDVLTEVTFLAPLRGGQIPVRWRSPFGGLLAETWDAQKNLVGNRRRHMPYEPILEQRSSLGKHDESPGCNGTVPRECSIDQLVGRRLREARDRDWTGWKRGEGHAETQKEIKGLKQEHRGSDRNKRLLAWGRGQYLAGKAWPESAKDRGESCRGGKTGPQHVRGAFLKGRSSETRIGETKTTVRSWSKETIKKGLETPPGDGRKSASQGGGSLGSRAEKTAFVTWKKFEERRADDSEGEASENEWVTKGGKKKLDC